MIKTEKRKMVLKWIKKQVEQLPDETYIAFHREIEIKKKNESEPKVRVVPMVHDVNHYRRCKRLYNKFGLEGVNFYFLLYGMMLKAV